MATFLFIWVAISSLSQTPKDKEVEVLFNTNLSTIEVVGLDRHSLFDLAKMEITQDHWTSILAIYVKGNYAGQASVSLLPVLGKYTVTATKILFHPRFPFSQGINYTAKFNAPYFYSLLNRSDLLRKGEVIETHFNIPLEKKLPSTKVTHIYPSTDSLPLNQLKFYIHFSFPMKTGNIYRYIKLIDEEGNIVEDPFLELNRELWDQEKRRLTLWFDPGRIKRGLAPHALLGLPLQQGRSYTLLIDKEWTDADGKQLITNFEKRFKVIGSDRSSPDHQAWTLTTPGVHTRETVELKFPEPLDHALLLRLIKIVDSKNQTIEGDVKTWEKEHVWSFHPKKNWENDQYKIIIDTKLEDLAGNNIQKLFDMDTTQGRGPYFSVKEVYIDFRPIVN
ncbi:hypothetical protein QQ008_17020 [Fulvivirgaceae bacterium BMA10]|uniref:SbsA Ig-like domain-containing protein n=1 Tax=Splendidivirga corallicola TaxID=3051826 RepID=A0ABT8KQS2_9BACT|nr:hypothetical protein [Fulvivirgaceae bacterium BMA10]